MAIIQIMSTVQLETSHVVNHINDCDAPLDLLHILVSVAKKLTPEMVEEIRDFTNCGQISQRDDALLRIASTINAASQLPHPEPQDEAGVLDMEATLADIEVYDSTSEEVIPFQGAIVNGQQ